MECEKFSELLLPETGSFATVGKFAGMRRRSPNRKFLTSEIRYLQKEGQVVGQIDDSTFEEVLRIQDKEEYGSVEDLLSEHFPALLTTEGRAQQVEFERDRRRMDRMGEFAPTIVIGNLPPKGPKEAAATPKQIAYLRKLGVRDEGFLTDLGKWQASAAIEQAIDFRDRLEDVEIAAATAENLRTVRARRVRRTVVLVAGVSVVLVLLAARLLQWH